MHPAVDHKDQLLMDILKDDARITNRRLARKVGLSPSACLARVRRLERHGYILGYRAVLGRAGAAYPLEGWAGVRLADASPLATRQFLDLVANTPEVIEAHRIAGRFDYSLRFCAGDVEVWNTFLRRLAALEINVDAQLNVLVETLK